MSPIPCAHCGHNFMRPTVDPEAPKLCNNCLLRENLRKPKEKQMKDTVGILIECPRPTQIDIEEFCLNQGVNFSQYFLKLHQEFFSLEHNSGDFLVDPIGEIIEEESEETNTQPYVKRKYRKKNK